MKNQSKYNPSRKTVGAIYRDAQMNHNGTPVIAGDLAHDITVSLVEDLNATIEDGAKEFEGKEFYITVHEKKDLQMPNAILRRLIKTRYRPYPEDDTVVFYVNPKGNDVRFCWCLPHWSEMHNILANEMLFEKEMVREIKCWKSHDLYQFGFAKDEMGNWTPNPHHVDRKLERPVQKVHKILTA